MAHFNASDIYHGAYVRFGTSDKRSGAAVVGPDNVVGDIGTIAWDTDESKRQRAWLQNPYGAKFGFLDPEASYSLALLQAKGWTIRYVLSFVAYGEDVQPGGYWGEVAIIAFAPRYSEQFEAFLQSFARQAGEGLRPDPDLNPAAVEAIASGCSWKPGGKVRIPRTDGRSAIIKDHRTIRDKILDQARSKNPGCYVISWLFIIAIVAGVVWALHSAGVF